MTDTPSFYTAASAARALRISEYYFRKLGPAPDARYWSGTFRQQPLYSAAMIAELKASLFTEPGI